MQLVGDSVVIVVFDYSVFAFLTSIDHWGGKHDELTLVVRSIAVALFLYRVQLALTYNLLPRDDLSEHSYLVKEANWLLLRP